jgi:hypothetical protein
METEKVRTIFQPDIEKDIPLDEAEILRAQGLLHEPAAPVAPEPAPAAAPVAEPAPTPMPKGAPADGGQ